MLITALAVAMALGPKVVATPNAEAIRAVYPEAAVAKHAGGGALLDCRITAAGAAEDCGVISASPPDVGFGEAALKLAGRFTFAAATGPAGPAPARLRFPVFFDWPNEAPGWIAPAWDKRPDADAIHAAWPRAALLAGLGGVAMINCRVNVHGVAEDCRVARESPENHGFGSAAMLLTPDFLFKPAHVGDTAVPARVVIPINFKFERGASPPTNVTAPFSVINRPLWTSAPTFAETGAAYPKGAGGAPGYVAMRCDVKGDGALRDCEVLREEPSGKGFARAARSLVSRFRLALETPGAPGRPRILVNLAVRLIDPDSDDFTARAVAEPVWARVPDPARAQALFPAEAAAKGVRTGVGVARCTVAANGALADCEPRPGRPDGLGFSEAAVAVASVMMMSPWTQEGGPVDGATISIPIRFKLADDAK